MDRTGEKQKKVVYDFICDDLYTPMKFKEMAMLLQVPKTRRQELKEVLEELEAEGKIAVSRRGKYYKGEAEKKTGIYRATRKGFGFVTVPEEETDIILLRRIREEPSTGMRWKSRLPAGLPGGTGGKDPQDPGPGPCQGGGPVSEETKAGLWLRDPGRSQILKGCIYPEGKEGGAADGHKVVAEFLSYGEDGRNPEGKIVEIIGHVNDPGTDILSIVKGYELPLEFPERGAKPGGPGGEGSKPCGHGGTEGPAGLADGYH